MVSVASDLTRTTVYTYVYNGLHGILGVFRFDSCTVILHVIKSEEPTLLTVGGSLFVNGYYT